MPILDGFNVITNLIKNFYRLSKDLENLKIRIKYNLKILHSLDSLLLLKTSSLMSQIQSTLMTSVSVLLLIFLVEKPIVYEKLEKLFI